MADFTSSLNSGRFQSTVEQGARASIDSWEGSPSPPFVFSDAVATGNLGLNDKIVWDMGLTTAISSSEVYGVELQIQLPDLDSDGTPTIVGKVEHDDGTTQTTLKSGFTEAQAGGVISVPLLGLQLHAARVYIEWTTAAATAQAGTIKTLWSVSKWVWDGASARPLDRT